MALLVSAEYVFALMVGGVTGAGLVLTIYSLLLTRGEELFRYRLMELKEAMHRATGLEKIRPEMTDNEFRRMKRAAEANLRRIAAFRQPPSYLGWPLLISFVLYGGTCLGAIWWYWVAPGIPMKGDLVTTISWAFGVATLFLLVTGIDLISDIRGALGRRGRRNRRRTRTPRP